MCHFITIAVEKGQEPLVERLRREFGFRTWPSTNPSIAAAMAPALVRLDVTVDDGMGQCSCDFVPRASDPARRASRLHASERKYRRFGWSEAKIQRGLAAKASSGERRVAEPQVQPFREFVARLATDLGSVHLFVHFYNGSVESERIAVSPSVTIALSDFTAESWQYPEDMVLRIESRGRRTRR